MCGVAGGAAGAAWGVAALTARRGRGGGVEPDPRVGDTGRRSAWYLRPRSHSLHRLQHGGRPGYLIQACELLIEARWDLKWSYAAAFFLKPTPQKDFFEFLQGDLEQDVELLSKLLEHDVPGQVAGYEERAVHKTQTTSRMNGVRQKLDNLEFHAAQDFVSAPSASGATLMAGGATSEEYDSNDLLDRRRRRARTTPASSGRVADPFPHKPSHTHRAGSTC